MRRLKGLFTITTSDVNLADRKRAQRSVYAKKQSNFTVSYCINNFSLTFKNKILLLCVKYFIF